MTQVAPLPHQPAQSASDAPSRPKDQFSSDRVNQAFFNLFGNNKPYNASVMQTPSFEQRQQIKIKPLVSPSVSSMNQAQPTEKKNDGISSMFSPVPSDCSLIGAKERYNPFTPLTG